MNPILRGASKTLDVNSYYDLVDMHDSALNIHTDYVLVGIRASHLLISINRIHMYLQSGREDDSCEHLLCARIIKTTSLALQMQEHVTREDAAYFCEELERIRLLLFDFQKMNGTLSSTGMALKERIPIFKEKHQEIAEIIKNIKTKCDNSARKLIS